MSEVQSVDPPPTQRVGADDHWREIPFTFMIDFLSEGDMSPAMIFAARARLLKQDPTWPVSGKPVFLPDPFAASGQVLVNTSDKGGLWMVSLAAALPSAAAVLEREQLPANVISLCCDLSLVPDGVHFTLGADRN